MDRIYAGPQASKQASKQTNKQASNQFKQANKLVVTIGQAGKQADRQVTIDGHNGPCTGLAIELW